MKILAISEHFTPRVGGTVEYVLRTCSALTARGHAIDLLVPGCNSDDQPRNSNDRQDGELYRVHALSVGWPSEGDPDRETRYRFAKACNEWAIHSAQSKSHHLVHNLFGLFINEELDTSSLARLGVPSVTTIHNIPPQECGRSWPGDNFARRVKDDLRKRIVAIKNQKRLQRNEYAAWIVPSDPVKESLLEVRPTANVITVNHGYSESLVQSSEFRQCRSPVSKQRLEILTVGGWAPHKRQHLIPDVCQLLQDRGIHFHWHLVGPTSRVAGYDTAIRTDIHRLGLSSMVTIHGAVPAATLAALYSNAHLYVQPSIEEGFCITALDAAAMGIPVIGSPAGAIPDLCELSEGVLVPSSSRDLAKAILHYQDAELWPVDSTPMVDKTRERFSWSAAAKDLESVYTSVLAEPTHRQPTKER